MTTILESLKNRRVLVTCGTGGVGKTTVAASLAVKAALMGRRVVVITIDPAKRLATSLGLEKLSHEPTDLTSGLEKAIGQKIEGRFSALMPKSEESFDRLIRSLTTHPDTLEKILKNPILATFSKEFSGANEYLALEELYHFYQRREFDLVILDTPPSRNTLSFLEAPKLLARFFEEKMIRWLVLPTNKLIAGGMRKAFSVLEKLTGAGFMNSLFDFGQALFEVQENFLKKLQNIHRMLQGEDVAFLLITGPSPENAPELGHFLDQIRDRGFHFDGVILNRSLTHLEDDRLAAQPANEIIAILKSREESALERLKAAAQKSSKNLNLFFLRLPELSRDVHSVEDLAHVAKAIE